MTDPTATATDPKGTPGAKSTAPARPVKTNLVKVIPTDRVIFDKQASTIRAYAAASGRDKKAVTNDEVAAVMSELAASSISLCNPFFSDAGLLIQEGRKLRPVEAVFDLQHAYEWNPETAGLKLRPIFSEHWAAKVLVPKLAFRQLSKDEAIGFLAEESKATTAHRKNLETLLDFLNFAGVIRIEGNVVQKANGVVLGEKERREDKDPPPPPPPVADLDPMILGLVKKLPPADSDWDVTERIKWLRTAANIFDLVYVSATNTGDILITTAPTTKQESPS